MVKMLDTVFEEAFNNCASTLFESKVSYYAVYDIGFSKTVSNEEARYMFCLTSTTMSLTDFSRTS